FEAHDRFAIRREPEMPRLDDARMDRTHRDLVQALALGGQENVSAGGALCFRRAVAGAWRPASVVEPGSRVGEAFRFEAPEVAYGALEAHGRRVRLPDRRKALVFADEA